MDGLELEGRGRLIFFVYRRLFCLLSDFEMKFHKMKKMLHSCRYWGSPGKCAGGTKKWPATTRTVGAECTEEEEEVPGGGYSREAVDLDFSGCSGSALGCCCVVACLFVFCWCWRFLGSLPWAYGLRLNELEGGRKRVSDILSTETVFGALRGAQPWFSTHF